MGKTFRLYSHEVESLIRQCKAEADAMRKVVHAATLIHDDLIRQGRYRSLSPTEENLINEVDKWISTLPKND